ncbi:MAG TPA: hypothetical protein VHB21_00810, partial [Minicystis sp.]|nr:hypothetical protein [Minicystis sp.]
MNVAAHGRALLAGLLRPSGASSIGAAVFCLVELALCCAFVTPRTLAAIPAPYLMQNDQDEYLLLSMRLLHYRLAKPRGLEVVYTGGSTATRSLLDHDPAVLSRALSQKAGRRVRFDV